MRKFFKILAGVWISGVVMGGGCVCGAAATGMLMERKSPTAREEWTQAQIDQLREEMSAMARTFMYDQIAANPIDEFAGLE